MTTSLTILMKKPSYVHLTYVLCFDNAAIHLLSPLLEDHHWVDLLHGHWHQLRCWYDSGSADPLDNTGKRISAGFGAGY